MAADEPLTASARNADGRRRIMMVGAAAIALVAGAVRLAAAWGDLWFDELWSLIFARMARSRWIYVLGLRHDNNHPFNTLVMAWWGPDVSGICYRLPAVAASLASMGLAAKIALRDGGPSAAVVASILFGGSYLMILYGSEARGYAYLIFFALWAWESLRQLDESRRWRDAAFFALSCCLGFLSHLTFAYAYAGFLAWTAGKARRWPFRLVLAAHALPLLTATYLYLFFVGGWLIPRMAIGGGPPTTLFSAILSTVSLTAGGAPAGDGALLAGLAVILLIAIGLLQTWRKDPALATNYATIIALAPAAVLGTGGAEFLYPRYFLVPVAFGLLVIAPVIAGWRRFAIPGRVAQAAVLAAYLSLNGWWTIRLLDHGRGDYSRALTWMADQSPDKIATVSSDFDFRNQTLYDYFSHRLGLDGVRLTYVDQRHITANGTDWLIRHNFEGDPPIPEFVNDGFGNTYRLERVFRHQSLSGWNWWAYRRVRQ